MEGEAPALSKIRKRRTGSWKICATCECGFYTPKHRAHNSKYCSRRCLSVSNTTPRHEVSCHICKSKFMVTAHRQNVAKYCGRRCYYKAMSRVGSIKLTCPCGLTFMASPSRNKKFCSVRCRGKYNRIAAEASITTYRNFFLRRHKLRACAACGYDKSADILVVHHKDRNRGNNSMDNLTLLCPNCHALEHLSDRKVGSDAAHQIKKQCRTRT